MIERNDSTRKFRTSFSLVVATTIAISAIVFLAGGLFAQKAYAVGGTLDQTLCESFGGVWLVDTCTITAGISVGAGETLTIPSGVELVIASSGIFSIGINNFGDIANSGTLTVSNTGGRGIENNADADITNSGDMTVSNTGGTGIRSFGVITNSGDMTVSTTVPSVGIGISGSLATIYNSGTLTLSNSGGHAISNAGGTIINTGTLTVSNSGVIAGATGIANGGTIINFGDMTVSNTGGTGIRNNDGIITNFAFGQITNTGSIINFSGSILNKCGGIYSGTPPDGNIVVNLPCTPSQTTQDLIDDINIQVTDKNVKSSLLGPLKQVQKILDDNNPSNDGAACGKLTEFINIVNSKEASGKLSSTLAEKYRDAANAIKSSIGC